MSMDMDEWMYSFPWKVTSTETSYDHLRQSRLNHNFTISVYCMGVVTCSLLVSVGSAVLGLARYVCVRAGTIYMAMNPPPGFKQWPLSSSEGLQSAH